MRGEVVVTSLESAGFGIFFLLRDTACYDSEGSKEENVIPNFFHFKKREAGKTGFAMVLSRTGIGAKMAPKVAFMNKKMHFLGAHKKSTCSKQRLPLPLSSD
jgi:hypothetical protein